MEIKNHLKIVDTVLIFVIAVLVTSGVLGVMQVIFGLDVTKGSMQVMMANLWVQNGVMLLAVALFLYHRKEKWTTLQLQRPEPIMGIAWGIVFGLGLFVVLTSFLLLLSQLLPNGIPAQNVMSYINKDQALYQKFLVFLTMGAIAPFVEEIFFRGYVFQSLRNYLGKQPAMVLAALVFGLAHMDIYRFVPLAIGGYVLNYLANRYQSLIPGMVAHGVWNSISIMTIYLNG